MKKKEIVCSILMYSILYTGILEQTGYITQLYLSFTPILIC